MASRNAINILKLNPSAEYPHKEGASNVYDITVCSRTNNRDEDSANDINEYGTGLSFTIPRGYYLELTAHPSLYKHGYTFIGPNIIDQNATAELIITLMKFKDGDDIELPLDVARMVAKTYTDVQISGQQKKGIIREEDYEYEEKKVEKSAYSNTTKPVKKGKNSAFF